MKMGDTVAASSTYGAWMDLLCAATSVPTGEGVEVANDFELMGVFADWCEDEGMPCAAALRWLVSLRKAPRHYTPFDDWNWDPSGDLGFSVTESCWHQEDIPRSLWDLMPGVGRSTLDGYATAREAYEDFFAGFALWWGDGRETAERRCWRADDSSRGEQEDG